jgi:hypothetical protein
MELDEFSRGYPRMTLEMLLDVAAACATVADAPKKEKNVNLVSRFRVSKDDPDRADPASEEVLLRFKKPFWNHDGGTILFDTREGADDGPASLALQTLLKRLDLPPLQRVPREHVLTKSFYLLRDFPGRNADGEVWVEAPREDGGEATSEALGDGVSSVVIGGGDWAAAWAADEYGRPLYAMAGGGERQREYAFRFGVNLVMYALTGNYKADQVHIPALLERMGQ